MVYLLFAEVAFETKYLACFEMIIRRSFQAQQTHTAKVAKLISRYLRFQLSETTRKSSNVLPCLGLSLVFVLVLVHALLFVLVFALALVLVFVVLCLSLCLFVFLFLFLYLPTK